MQTLPLTPLVKLKRLRHQLQEAQNQRERDKRLLLAVTADGDSIQSTRTPRTHRPGVRVGISFGMSRYDVPPTHQSLVELGVEKLASILEIPPSSRGDQDIKKIDEWMRLHCPTSLFRNLQPDSRKALYREATFECHSPEAVLFFEDQPADKMYVLLHGAVDIWRRRPENGDAQKKIGERTF